MKKPNTTQGAKSKQRGRPEGSTKLTKAIQETITTAIRQGNYIETAAALVGIHKDTIYAWLRKGITAKADNDKYKSFSDALSRAMAESEAMAVAAIHEAGMPHPVTRCRTARKPLFQDGQQVTDADGKPVYITETITEQFTETDWRALAWRLERRFPRRWGHRSYTETTVAEKPVEQMSDAEIDGELAEILEKVDA